jgi:hypothetical protein
VLACSSPSILVDLILFSGLDSSAFARLLSCFA